MKKSIFEAFLLIIVIVAVLFICVTLLTSCNQQVADTTYKFDRAIIYLPNGEIVEGEVDSWCDYEDSDQIQVTIDGTTYYCHHSNVVLIKEAE